MSQEALYSSLTSFLSALSSHAPKISSCRVRSTLSHVFSRKLRDLMDNSQRKTDIPKSDARDNVIFLKADANEEEEEEGKEKSTP
jgi:hypothetical protein